jgi:uncharacterized protein (TIGR00369 family)
MQLDRDGLTRFFEEQFPQAKGFTIERATDEGVTLKMPFRPSMLRPGGTVSGPTLMTLADTASYAALLSQIGPVALAVTADLHIRFLRKPAPADLRAEGRIMKLGKKLAILEVTIFSEGAEPVAHATVSYAIPGPRGS